MYLDAPAKMSVEIEKEIQLEIAHVLFIDIRYLKLLINEQRSAVDELTRDRPCDGAISKSRGV